MLALSVDWSGGDSGPPSRISGLAVPPTNRPRGSSGCAMGAAEVCAWQRRRPSCSFLWVSFTVGFNMAFRWRQLPALLRPPDRSACVFLEDSWVIRRMGTPHQGIRQLPPHPPPWNRRDPASSGGTGRCTALHSAQRSASPCRLSSPRTSQNHVAVYHSHPGACFGQFNQYSIRK